MTIYVNIRNEHTDETIRAQCRSVDTARAVLDSVAGIPGRTAWIG